MQCHAIVLDRTSTTYTYTRQQHRRIVGRENDEEQRTKTNERKKAKTSCAYDLPGTLFTKQTKSDALLACWNKNQEVGDPTGYYALYDVPPATRHEINNTLVPGR